MSPWLATSSMPVKTRLMEEQARTTSSMAWRQSPIYSCGLFLTETVAIRKRHTRWRHTTQPVLPSSCPPSHYIARLNPAITRHRDEETRRRAKQALQYKVVESYGCYKVSKAVDTNWRGVLWAEFSVQSCVGKTMKISAPDWTRQWRRPFQQAMSSLCAASSASRYLVWMP